jgi:hypothetical protein
MNTNQQLAIKRVRREEVESPEDRITPFPLLNKSRRKGKRE